MERDPESSNAQRLVYRERSHPTIGIPVLLLGLVAIAYFGVMLAKRLPGDFQLWGEGGILSMLYGLLCPFAVIWVLFGLGIILSRSQELIFEKPSGQIIKTLRLLVWNRLVRHSYTDFDSVTWKPRRRGGGVDGGGSTLYPIILTGPQAKLKLFEETCLEDARRTTREIGEFTGFKQKHWDAGLLTQDAEDAAYADRMASARRRLSFVGIGPRWRVSRSGGTLEYVQTFEPFVRIISGAFAVIGACLLIWSLCASKTLPNEQFWLGGIFFIVFLPLLFARRGVTIDVNWGVVRLWVSLIVPVWSRSHRLSDFSAVEFERQVEEVNSNPCVVGRVVLVGESDRRVVLFKSAFIDQITPFAGEIAELLDFPVAGEVGELD